MDRAAAHERYRRFVNPDFVDLLESFDYGRRFVRAEGTRLHDDQGRGYTDFLAGYGVHNLGHNHPRLIDALARALAGRSPSMLNIDAPEAASLAAERLNARTHPSLVRASFANSGSEAVEMALKTARAATGRLSVVACRNAYHGLTTGALSLMDDPGHIRPFGDPSLPVRHVPFDDVGALEQACREVKPGAFIVEPIQGEGGVRVPPPDYLETCARVCRAAGCLFIVDEVQTGLGRAGEWFATPFARATPDILVLGKALSGGVIPAAAMLTTAEVWKRAFGSPDRCHLNASTFAGGHLAMTAAVATLEILESDRLVENARALAPRLEQGLREIAGRHSAIVDVRGQGLFWGMELAPPKGIAFKAVPAWAREGLHAHVICALLLADHGMITQPCAVRQGVLRVEPPLCVTEEEIGAFFAAIDHVLAEVPTPAAALRRAFRRRVLGGAL